MHIFLTILGIYIAGMIAIWAWDAYVGLGNDSDKPGDRIPTGVLCFLWPIIIIFAPFFMLSEHLDKIKKKRIAKERQAEKIRIASELEEEKILKQVEEEMANERKASYKA